MVHKANTVITASVLGVGCVFTGITSIDIRRVVKLFEGVSVQNLNRQVDSLIGCEYATFQPIRMQAAGQWWAEHGS